MRHPTIICAALAAIALTACRPQRAAVPAVSVPAVSDSVRVEHVIEYVPDTVTVTLPPALIERTVRDSTSFIATAFAASRASILPDGSLLHTLSHLDAPLDVPLLRPVEKLKFVRTVTRTITRTVTVPAELSWWQSFQLRAFPWITGALALCLTLIVRRFVRN